jgi:hypothetical protein
LRQTQVMQVAKLLEPNLKEGHIIRYLGTLQGTPTGGMEALYRFAVDSSPTDPLGATGSIHTIVETGRLEGIAVTNAESGQTGSEFMGIPRAAESELQVNLKDKASKAVQNALQSLTELQASMLKAPADDVRWKSVEITANLMTFEVKKTAASATQGPWAGSVASMPVCPTAPKTQSTKRLKSKMEGGKGNRSRAPLGERVHAGDISPPANGKGPRPGANTAEPFLRPHKAGKQRSILQQAAAHATQGQKRKAAAAKSRFEAANASRIAKDTAHLAKPSEAGSVVAAGTGLGAAIGAEAVAEGGAGVWPGVGAGAVAEGGAGVWPGVGAGAVAREAAGVGRGTWIGAGLGGWAELTTASCTQEVSRAALTSASCTQEVPQRVAVSRGASTVDWLFAPALQRESGRLGGTLQPLIASEPAKEGNGALHRSRKRPKHLVDYE